MANLACRSVKAVWTIVKDEFHLYLPPHDHKSVTMDYLFGLATE